MFLHIQCAIHIINLIVINGLKYVYESITKISDAFRYMKYSIIRFSIFKACVVKKKISGRMLCLDIPTRWNSIYLMLSTIEKYKKKI